MKNGLLFKCKKGKNASINSLYKILITLGLGLFWVFPMGNVINGQVTQFPQVFYNGQGAGGSTLYIRQSASLSASSLTSLGVTGRIGAETYTSSIEPSYGAATWAVVNLPSTTGSIRRGYMIYGQYYARIAEINNYAIVTAITLNIRPCAGCTTDNVKIGGQPAYWGQNSIIALTGNVSNGWYECYLTLDCSQQTGWVSGTYLNVNTNTNNYFNVAGTVNNNNNVSIWGATITISGASINSTEGFYQYKLPVVWSGTITCTHPSYNTSSPSFYSHTANTNYYNRNFILSNACPNPSPPTNLIVTAVTPTTVDLSWSAVSGSGVTYEVFKNNTSCSFTFGSSGLLTSSTYGTVTGLIPGTQYYFVVVAKNSCGNSSAFSVCVNTTTQNGASTPIANFTANKSTILINETVQFYDLSQNNPTSWNWEFARESSQGNYSVVATSTQQNPLVTFNPYGGYRVRLTATNSAGSHSITRTSFIYVKPDPTWTIPAAAAQSIQNYTYYSGDPVNAAQGIFTFSQFDLGTNGRKTKVGINRFYTSRPNGPGSFGPGWYCDFDKWLSTGEWQTRLYKADGSYVDFIMYSNGKMESTVPALHDSMSYTQNAGIFSYTYHDRIGNRWIFDNNGYLIKVVDLDENTTEIIRSGGVIQRIIAPGGRELIFTYTPGVLSITNSIDTAFYYFSNSGLLDSVRIRDSKYWYKYNANNKLEEIISPNGFRISKNEYSGDQVTRQWDALDGVTQFQYNTPSTNYTTITNAAGKTKVVKHDASFQITERKDEQNNFRRFVQTPDHQVDSLIDENGNGYKFYNTPDGYVYKSVDPLLNADSTGYTAFGRPVYQKDKEGNITTINYSATLLPTTITFANGGVIQKQYDQYGQDTAITDQLLHKTRKSYNLFGDITKFSRTYSSDSLIYDAIGRPVVHVNGRGFTDSVQYNHFGLPVRKVDQLGKVELFSYDPNGNLVTYTDKDAIVTELVYDAKDRLIRIIKAGVMIREFVWDGMDYLVRVRDANKNCRIITNDDLGRPLIVADSVLGVLAQYGFDAAGNQVLYKNSLGQPWHTKFDKLNQTVGVKNPLNDSIIIVRNKNGLPVEEIDESGKSTKFVYNSMNVLIKTTDKSLKSVSIFPNLKGLPDSIRDSRGFYRRMTYDEDDRPKTFDEGYGQHFFFFDAANHPIKHITATGSIIENDFNPRNELINEKWNGTIVKQFGYTNTGRLNYAWTPTNSLYKYFNALGFLIKDSATFGGAITYQPDLAGNVRSVTLSDGKSVSYGFNSINVNTSVTDWGNRTFQINRDNDGGVTAYIYPNNFRTDIGRNAAYQVNSWINSRTAPSNTVVQANKLLLGKGGEIISDTASVNFYPANTTGPASLTAAYGPADRRNTYGAFSINNDANGNITGITGPGINNSYVPNPDNTTASINHYGIQSVFTHNAFGNRVSKTAGASVTRYSLSNSFAAYPVILQESDGSDNVTATNLYSADGILLGRDSAGVFSCFHHNAFGNTSFLSDGNGTVTNSYAYALFGNYFTQTGASTQPYTWQGMYGVQKEGKDLYYLWARLYDANMGSFLSPDPVQGSLAETRSLNPYLYGLNDPASYGDPTGLYPQGVNTISLNWFDLNSDRNSYISATNPNAVYSTLLDYSGNVANGLYKNLNNIGVGSNQIVYQRNSAGNIFNGNQHTVVKRLKEFSNEIKGAGRALEGVNLFIAANDIHAGFIADGSRVGNNTIIQTAGFVGGYAGGIIGVKTGAILGAPLGGPVGSIIGAAVLGTVGSFIGERGIENLTKKILR